VQMPRDTLVRLLEELAQWLDFEDCEPVEWVVCGGVALALQGLQSRTTRDVDVLGNWVHQSMVIACIEDFPEKVKTCIQRVADNHPELAGLSARWVNLGPARLARFGLPEGFERRLMAVRFGNRLTLQLLSRQDLLPLKLYAAADDLGRRQQVHEQDLKAMSPTFGELDGAINWLRKLPDFEEKRVQLKDVVRSLGYDDLSYYV